MQEKIAKLKEISAYLKEDAYSEQLARMERMLEKKEYLLTVMGQFSAGKSRLINSLLNRAVLPVHITETTAVVTLIRYGREERAELFYKDGTAKTVAIEESLQLWQSGSADISKIAQIILYIDSSLLKNGLILADTPGVNTVIREHSRQAEEIITSSDRVLYVMGKPMTEADQSFAGSILQSGIQVIFVRTHMDEVKSTEEDIEKTMQAERAGLNGMTSDEVFFVSNERESETYDAMERLRTYLSLHLAECVEKAAAETADIRLRFIAGRLSEEVKERSVCLRKGIDGGRQAYEAEKKEIEDALKKLEQILEKNKASLQKKYEDRKKDALQELPEIKKAEIRTAEKQIRGFGLGAEPEPYLPKVEEVLKRSCYSIQKSFVAFFDQIISDNRMELKETLSGFEGFSDLGEELPLSLGEFQVQSRELEESARALQMLLGQMDEQLDRLDVEQNLEQQDARRLEQEKKELAEVRAVIERKLAEYPEYEEKYIIEEGSHTNEDILRTIGKAADIATLLIPGETWLKFGGKLFKGLGMGEKAVKAAKDIDMFVDGLRLVHRLDIFKKKEPAQEDIWYVKNPTIEAGTKAADVKKPSIDAKKKAVDIKNPIAVAKKKVAEESPSLLDYLSIEYYLAKLGRKFDRPQVTRIDEKYRRQYQEGKQKLEQEMYHKAAQEAEKQSALLDITDRQKQLELERRQIEKKRKKTAEQVAALEKEMAAAAEKEKISAIQAFYAQLVAERLESFCTYIRTEVAKQTDEAVQKYMDTYDFGIVSRIKNKRRSLQELEQRFRSEEFELPRQELALCDAYAAYLANVAAREANKA